MLNNVTPSRPDITITNSIIITFTEKGCFCPILIIAVFSSDGWTTDDLKYQWKSEEPVQITRDLHLPRFSLEKYVSDYCNIKTNTGEPAERNNQYNCVSGLCGEGLAA